MGVTELTGALAVILIFLSGPYRTLQKWRPRTWGPVLSVFAHSNISLASATAVFVHLLFVGEVQVKPELSADPSLLTWVATLLFAISFVSGLYGLYIARTPRRRQRWVAFHRTLTTVFYLAIISHVVAKGVFSWTVFLLVGAAWVLWSQRARVRHGLAQASWPFSKRTLSGPISEGGWRLPLTIAAVIAVFGLAAMIIGTSVVELTLAEEGEEDEIVGRIVELRDGSFILQTSERIFRVDITSGAEIELDGETLSSLQQLGKNVKVEGKIQTDGTVLATEIGLDWPGDD